MLARASSKKHLEQAVNGFNCALKPLNSSLTPTWVDAETNFLGSSDSN